MGKVEVENKFCRLFKGRKDPKLFQAFEVPIPPKPVIPPNDPIEIMPLDVEDSPPMIEDDPVPQFSQAIARGARSSSRGRVMRVVYFIGCK